MNLQKFQMLAAHAQAMQLSGHWEFAETNERAFYRWKSEGRTHLLFFGDEGFSYQCDREGVTGNEVPVESLSHLKQLIAES